MILGAQSARAADGPPPVPIPPPTATSSPLQSWIDHTVPAPPLVAAANQSLWRSVLASPVGDPFFDDWPAGLAGLRPGQLIEQRDDTAKAATLSTTPIGRATLLKFRSTSASGAPSFGTATLIVPATAWHGPGPRPVQVHALPINSLGRECTPGYTISRGEIGPVVDVFLPKIWSVLSRGSAVLIPDHEGPFMSYAEPLVAGHEVLDSIRAVRSLNQFRDSSFGITGYSGGAIASYAAAMLLNDYAPELAHAVVGAAMGGLVTDYRAVAHHFNGNMASGILLSVALAMAREHPDLLPYMNHLAQQVATSPMKDICGESDGPLGLVGIPIDIAANVDRPLDSPVADDLYRKLDLTNRKSAVPLYIYHGISDAWIPIEGPRTLYRRQCGQGVSAVFQTLPGDHLSAIAAGTEAAERWLTARFRGTAAPSTCNTSR